MPSSPPRHGRTLYVKRYKQDYVCAYRGVNKAYISKTLENDDAHEEHEIEWYRYGRKTKRTGRCSACFPWL